MTTLTWLKKEFLDLKIKNYLYNKYLKVNVNDKFDLSKRRSKKYNKTRNVINTNYIERNKENIKFNVNYYLF